MLVRALSGSYNDLAIKKGKFDHKTLVQVSYDYRKSIVRVENKLVVFYPIFSYCVVLFNMKCAVLKMFCCAFPALLPVKIIKHCKKKKNSVSYQ